ncbi:hypothetical protein PCANC_02970 [Puccinia coronata f. sp. avenae]|uniref:Uncharacterized protein n=1 Tax=Puccinia coronata f. sp. avenae TaxID=200324 RepID=A0A2N5W157_9BASI|nr:hypothetical protein PCANC_02970 [Puccinia coronata f. sp. avenae]
MVHHQASRSGNQRSLMKNARSFFVNLISHSQHASDTKEDEPQYQTPQDEPQPEEAAVETISHLPPDYEIAMQTTSHLLNLTNAPDDLQERLACSATERRRSILFDSTNNINSTPSSYVSSPLTPNRPTFLLPTSHHREETERMQVTDERRTLRPSSSRQSCNSNNSRSSKRPSTRKFTKASSVSSLNSHRNANNPRSVTRRDRELIAAKKSLPILTKFDKSSSTYQNVPPF